MAQCLNPFEIKTKEGVKIVPCRHCVNCTVKKIQYQKLLARAEMTERHLKGQESSFVRLSYNDAFLPCVIFDNEEYKIVRGGQIIDLENKVFTKDFKMSLMKSDLQKFMKRLRQDLNRHYAGRNISYLYAGEYGDLGRPHYHICLFGLSDYEAQEFTSKNWDYGFITAYPLLAGAVNYITKYIFQDCFGEEKLNKYNRQGVEPPFYHHSNNLGRSFFIRENDGSSVYIDKKHIQLPSYLMKKYGLSAESMDIETIRQIQKESPKIAENYVTNQRQLGIPIDDTSIFLRKKDVNLSKINKLTKEAQT